LEALVGEVALDELRHGPIEEQGARFLVVAETVFNLLAGGWVADPKIVLAWRSEGVAEAAEHVVHCRPAGDICGRQGADFGGAAILVVPELNAGTIEEGDEEAVHGGSPFISAAGQVEFFDEQRMEQAGEVGARGHAHAGEWFLNGACAAYADTAFDDEDTLAGAGEISGAGEAVVTGADDDCVPAACGELADGDGEADFAKDGGGG